MAVLLLLAACQSRENADLKPANMSLEDPLYHASDEPLRMGKVHFREGAYGLAENDFRRAVEVSPRDAEAWMGLAATYDQLRRFDLADNAYAKVLQLAPRNAIYLNNIGYSQLLRGNNAAARKYLLKAYELDPQNPYIQNNIQLLGESGQSVKRAEL